MQFWTEGMLLPTVWQRVKCIRCISLLLCIQW